MVPAGAAAYIPWWILTSNGGTPHPIVWPAVALIAAGVALYFWCLWNFATRGRGTPGPWDPPRHFVASGPYRFVRNPMYIAVLLVIAGEALLFVSVQIAVYFIVFALFVHAFVLVYEEPTLHDMFGDEYDAYRRTVHRWIPRAPAAG